jgi:hypothetical protein
LDQRWGDVGPGLQWFSRLSAWAFSVVGSFVVNLGTPADTLPWAAVYAPVHAAPDGADLVYFAFVNYATLGYGDTVPVAEWHLLGPMASMNGILLFGWSTAVIFEVMRKTIAEHPSFASTAKP